MCFQGQPARPREQTAPLSWLFRRLTRILQPRKALLPPLENNIKCGNSLIASDFSVIPDDLVRVHAFDWPVQFPAIMKAGGFDAVMGNPPYIRPHKMEPEAKQYFWRTLTTFVAKSDIYSCFMERGLGLLRSGGHFSFIVPHTWTSLESFEAIRRKVAGESEVLKLVQLPKKVFQDATVETCVFCVRRPAGPPSDSHLIEVVRLDAKSNVTKLRTFPQSDIKKAHLHNFQLYVLASDGFMRLGAGRPRANRGIWPSKFAGPRIS